MFAAYPVFLWRTPSVKVSRFPAWRAWVTAVSKASRWRCTFMSMIDGMWAVWLTLSEPPCHPVVGQLVSCSHPTAILTASCREWLGLISWSLGCALSRSTPCRAVAPSCDLSTPLAQLGSLSLVRLRSPSLFSLAQSAHLLPPFLLFVLLGLRGSPLCSENWSSGSCARLQRAVG